MHLAGKYHYPNSLLLSTLAFHSNSWSLSTVIHTKYSYQNLVTNMLIKVFF